MPIIQVPAQGGIYAEARIPIFQNTELHVSFVFYLSVEAQKYTNNPGNPCVCVGYANNADTC